eukprot:TRINITY_DN841_c0_g1_i4.p1 TRINITY_DN841_c0_g1~~TRINITY_DN841_c0_g1_i4.p1  ORF type:complete len:550 (-),score=167.59 TRINITY_DN841_c0_g1_i4:90-1739(-)
MHRSLANILIGNKYSFEEMASKENQLEWELRRLQAQNAELLEELERLKSCKRTEQSTGKTRSAEVGLSGSDAHVSIIVIGASGDLAKKKTFPSLWALYGLGLFPPNVTVFGFARTPMSDEDFRKFLSQNFKGWEDKKESFLSKCFYHHGQYNSAEAFGELDKMIREKEGNLPGNRVFYFAIPPSIFVDVARAVKSSAMGKSGWTRLIVEKPFGHDSESSALLSKNLAELFDEEQLYRIDHYLGKEMVQNLMTLRFANLVFEPLWNRNNIANVSITFKEDIGTEGRGGYFDSFGIIRDVMQNHLLQILALTAMEPPVALSAEDIRDEKVKVLRACRPIVKEDLVIGQYGRDPEGKIESYLDDPTVPKGSVTPTFALAVIHIDNARWRGVPFILKCGKALNERKAEIRVQFKRNAAPLFRSAPRNELVIRVQPNEAVYMKFNSKVPGLSTEILPTELDITYKKRFDVRLPDAYERLIYDVLRGDHNLFVRDDELEAAWNIFTPILHHIEKEKVAPEIYPFGSRGPVAADNLAAQHGFERTIGYEWKEKAKI